MMDTIKVKKGQLSLATEPDPIEIVIERRCTFKKKAKREGMKRAPGGCERCGLAKFHLDHLGAPPSLNDGGAAMTWVSYQNLKQAWESAFADALDASELPKDLESVRCEMLIGFDQYRDKDEGNFRWMAEKALGDALVAGGWLQDDTFWPVLRYSMGNLQGIHTPGQSFTRIILFGSFTPPIPEPRSNTS